MILAASALVPIHPARAASVPMTINISHTGFNPVTFTVNQGDVVTITIMNVDALGGNNHGFELKDPDGVTRFDLLQVSGYSNGLPEGASYVFTFTADKAGNWTFFCNLGCFGHSNLQNGVMTVAGQGFADLVGKSAWPEHHHFVISKDEDGMNTLYAKIANLGGSDETVFAHFAITPSMGTGTIVETTPVLLPKGTTMVVSVGFTPSSMAMKYSVLAHVHYTTDPTMPMDTWPEGNAMKHFSFAVVP